MSKTLTFEISDKFAENFERLKRLSECTSDAELIKRALATYDMALENLADPQYAKSWVQFVGQRADGTQVTKDWDIT